MLQIQNDIHFKFWILVIMICLEFRISDLEFPDAVHQGRPSRELTAAFLPSSLTRNHSFALVYSTNPPVSVSGTVPACLTLEDFPGRLFTRILSPERKSFAHTGRSN